MPSVRFLASKYYTYIVAVILLLSKIIPIYSCYTKKKLVYIIIAALFSCSPSSYAKCTKLNIYLSCDIYLIFNAKYAFLMHLYSL